MHWRSSRHNSDSNSLRSARRGSERAGSLVIEAVISVALLASATYALTKLARSTAELNRQTDQRLAATLTAENALERLRGLSAEQVAQQVAGIAQSMSESSGCDVEITSAPFVSGDRGGIHIRVDVVPSENARVTLHDWRLEAEPTNEAAQDDAASSETSEGDDA